MTVLLRRDGLQAATVCSVHWSSPFEVWTLNFHRFLKSTHFRWRCCTVRTKKGKRFSEHNNKAAVEREVQLLYSHAISSACSFFSLPHVSLAHPGGNLTCSQAGQSVSRWFLSLVQLGLCTFAAAQGCKTQLYCEKCGHKFFLRLVPKHTKLTSPDSTIESKSSNIIRISSYASRLAQRAVSACGFILNWFVALFIVWVSCLAPPSMWQEKFLSRSCRKSLFIKIWWWVPRTLPRLADHTLLLQFF